MNAILADLPIAQEPPLTVVYAGVWRRIFAVAIDSFFVGLVGGGIGLVGFATFAQLGWPGRHVGAGNAAFYLVPAYCATCGGQTLGKRLLGLRVQRLDGGFAPASGAALRYIVLAVPLGLNGILLSPSSSRVLDVALGTVLITIVFGGLLGNLYLLIFNSPSRRLLHDLAAGTVVVRTDSAGLAATQTALTRGRKVTLVAIPVAVLSIGAAAVVWLHPLIPALEKLQAVQERLQALPAVMSAGVSDEQNWRTGKQREHVLSLTLRVNEWPADPQQAMRSFVEEANTPELALGSYDRIAVTLIYGFDIGIASGWRKVFNSHPWADWQRATGK